MIADINVILFVIYIEIASICLVVTINLPQKHIHNAVECFGAKIPQTATLNNPDSILPQPQSVILSPTVLLNKLLQIRQLGTQIYGAQLFELFDLHDCYFLQYLAVEL